LTGAIERAVTEDQSHLFLSYSSSDRESVLAIADALEASGMAVWIDRRGLSGGDLWAAEITVAIRSCSAFVLLCSEASMASRNVRQELQLAWDHDRTILPVLLEMVEFPDEFAYFVQGRQWIEALGRPPAEWIAQIGSALSSAKRERASFSARAPARQAQEVVTNLPVPPAAIVGRDAQIAGICELLQRRATQLVTLVGPGGVGKTRLSLAAAWQFREAFSGAIHFVNLATVREPSLVIPVIAEEVGLKDLGQQSLIERLHETLIEQPVLLVLDNLEQVLEAAGDIGELLAGLPLLAMLATSREPLRLRAEQIVEVLPLTISQNGRRPTVEAISQIPAVELFVTRAAAAKQGFALTEENCAAVAEICQRLDGLPLAIELAASRSSLMSPAMLLKRLENRLPLLTGGARDLPDRQRTLRDTIAWSEDLLSDGEKALWRRLSVFSGGFTLEAALAVTEGTEADQVDADVLQSMERLAAHSLLQQFPTADGELRFSMLETIREFSQERLAASGNGPDAHRRHAEWVLALVEVAAPELNGPNQDVWLSRLRQEYDNARAALTWSVASEPDVALRLCVGLHDFWLSISANREGSTWCDRALESGADEDPNHLAFATYTAARLAYRQRDHDRAIGLGRRALELFEQLGDQRGIALAKSVLGSSYASSGGAIDAPAEEISAAETLLWEALDVMRTHSELFQISLITNNLALLNMNRNDLPAALDLLNESAAASRAIGDKFGFAFSSSNIVEVLVALERVEEALPILLEMVEDQLRLRHRGVVSNILTVVALSLSARGEMVQAARLYGAADTELQLIGFGVEGTGDVIVADIDNLREQLGSEAFDEAWAAGAALSPDEAMDEAYAALMAWASQRVSVS
jgi:predicted ATPase